MHKAGSRHTDIRHESTSMHTPGQEGLQMIEATSCGGVVIFRGKILVLYCDRGGASLLAARVLARNGYETRTVIGGMNAYRGRNLICDIKYEDSM